MMKIEKTYESIDENRHFLINNQINNNNSLINIPKNLSSTNKSLINHIEFLQKQFQAQQLNIDHDRTESMGSFSCNQFQTVNELLKNKPNLKQSSLNKNQDPSIVNQNHIDQKYKADFLKLNILKATNENSLSEINNKQYVSQSLPLSNHINNKGDSLSKNSLSSINNNSNAVIPPPGFSLNPMNLSVNQTNFLNPSSSTGSSSSSNSSSLNNSASTTPAIVQANVLLQSKPKLHQKTIESTADNNISFKNNLNTNQIEITVERNNVIGDNYDENINLTENNTFTVDSIDDHSFTNRLHKTLKSILPNANISFGNYNNNNKPYQSINSVPTSNFKVNDGNFLWSDDPAIVSLTDRFDSDSNINNLANLGSFLGISGIQYSNYLGEDVILNKNDSSSTYFYNTFSNNFSQKKNSNNIDEYSINNGENISNEISNDNNNNNNHINKFQDEVENKHLVNMNKNSNRNTSILKKELELYENELLDANKNTQFNIIKSLSTNLCSNNNSINSQNDLFFNYCENNSYAFNNQSNNISSVNNNLSLQQQMFIQQLTANLSSNKKMPNEYKK
jgi:hypothetical protein